MSYENELMNCPFCNCKPNIITGDNELMIKCVGCGATISKTYEKLGFGYKSELTEDEVSIFVEKYWNKRAKHLGVDINELREELSISQKLSNDMVKLIDTLFISMYGIEHQLIVESIKTSDPHVSDKWELICEKYRELIKETKSSMRWNIVALLCGIISLFLSVSSMLIK